MGSSCAKGVQKRRRTGFGAVQGQFFCMAPLNEPKGYWGSPTSTLDWCESNYEVSYYIAEFWNTITNLMMIIPSLKGLYTVKQQNFESRIMDVSYDASVRDAIVGRIANGVGLFL